MAFRPNPYFPIRTLPLLRAAPVARGAADRHVKTVLEAIGAHEKNLNEPEEARAMRDSAAGGPRSRHLAKIITETANIDSIVPMRSVIARTLDD